MTDFTTQQRTILRKLFENPPVTTGLGNAEKFLLQYVFFEALVRLIGDGYREHMQNKKSNAYEPLKINVVRRSFTHFCIQESDECFDLLLNSKSTKRKHNSARNLRNGLVHRWKAEDVEEVRERYEVLSGALTEMIAAIKTRFYHSTN